jgi:serine/threonine-protein kinase
VLGTPEYMSPEQARGEKADERSDLYSIGAVLYELLAGRPPFGGKDTIAILRQHVQSPAPSLRELAPGTPAELERIIARLLAKKPSERYPDVAQLWADLGKLAPAGPPTQRIVQDLLARAAQAVSRPTRVSAGAAPRPGAGLMWESPAALRGKRVWTWVALVTASVAVAALVVALVALFTGRPKAPIAPEHAAVPAGTATPAPSAGTLWRVTTRDKKQFDGEFVSLASGPGNETTWLFHLPDGTYKWVQTSELRMMTQKAGEAP